MITTSIAPVFIACLSVLTSYAIAQAGSPASAPVNDICPIGKEPIVPSAGTIEHEGSTVGFCCPGCDEAFLAWDDERKDEFVTLWTAQRGHGQDHTANDDDSSATSAASPGPSYPYTLPDCPVGGPLGSMGDPVVKVYDNREVRFC